MKIRSCLHLAISTLLLSSLPYGCGHPPDSSTKSTKPQIKAQQPVKKYDRAIDLVQLEEMRLKELLPADAVEYVNAASDCAHWAGEEPYDKKRAREIASKSKQDCSKVERLKNRSRPNTRQDLTPEPS